MQTYHKLNALNLHSIQRRNVKPALLINNKETKIMCFIRKGKKLQRNELGNTNPNNLLQPLIIKREETGKRRIRMDAQPTATNIETQPITSPIELR